MVAARRGRHSGAHSESDGHACVVGAQRYLPGGRRDRARSGTARGRAARADRLPGGAARQSDRPGVPRLPAARARRRGPAARPRPRRGRTPTSAPSGSASQQVGLSDGSLETLVDADDLGLAVRVVVDGTWGFAAGGGPHPGRRGCAPPARRSTVARVAAAINAEPIELAAEPAYGEVTLGVRLRDRPVRRSASPTRSRCWRAGAPACSAATGVDHVDASLHQVRECKFYADGATTAIQQRVRLHPELTAVAVERRRPVRDHAHAGPAGRAGAVST